ncbi:MAG: hypothetical protein M3518_02630 [Actinomycetota bacterium]|nr:hypothetical protein [Actinomycetota bacterium]
MLSRRLTSSGLLLVFLAGIIVCLCGMLGYQHAPVLGGVDSPEVHLSGSQTSSVEGLSGDHGPAGTISTAALFVVFLGAALGLLFAARKWLGTGAVLTARRLPPPIVLPPPRIPARSQLQVFLL